MDFDFAPDTLMLRDMLRRFLLKDVRPLEMKFFTTGKLEPDERDRLRRSIEQMGLWGLTVPEEHGGGGLDLVTTCLMEIELGSTFIPIEIGEVPEPLYACSGAQIARYLEPALMGERKPILAVREPGVLNPHDWTTLATPGENGGQARYLLNGCKLLGVDPEQGDFFILIARAPQGYTAFLVEPDDGNLTWQQTNAGKREITLQLSNYEASSEAILGEPGEALMLVAPSAHQAWIRTGARYVGLVERLLEMALEHAKDWVVYGASVSTRPAIQRMLAEIKADIESSRWLVYHAAWLADEGRPDQARNAAAQVRLVTGEMLKRAIDKVTMIYAGPGPSAEIEPGRLVYSVIPPDALKIGLEKARAEIAVNLLGLQ